LLIFAGRDGFARIYDCRKLDSPPLHQIETDNITFVRGDLIRSNEASLICLPDAFETSQWNLWNLEGEKIDLLNEKENPQLIESNTIDLGNESFDFSENKSNKTDLIQTVLPPKSENSKLGMLMGLHTLQLKDKSDYLVFSSFESGQKNKKKIKNLKFFFIFRRRFGLEFKQKKIYFTF
jgi:hypothetical protein